MDEKQVLIRKIKGIIDKSTASNKFKVLINGINSLSYISSWAHKYKFKISLIDRLKLSIFVGILFSRISEESAVMYKFFSSIALQRYWDDLYDKRTYTFNLLKEIREYVLEGKHSDNKDSFYLKKAIDEILNISFEDQNVEMWLRNNFYNELDSLIDGYEFEFLISESAERNISEADYMKHSIKTISLHYTMAVVGFLLVKNANDLENFKVILPYIDICAESIRLANDLSGHAKEQKENKLDLISIRSVLYNERIGDSEKFILKRIYDNLSKFDELMLNNNNKMVEILKTITYLAISRYLKNGL